MNRMIHILWLIPVVGLSLLAGCGDSQTAASSASASGNTLQTECVASYFKVNASPYMTQQQHRFTPSTGRLRVTADEPTGRYECVLQQNQFTVVHQNTRASADLPDSFFNKALATTVFYSMCAGGSLLDTAQMTSGEPVKVLGQWFVPLTPAWPKNQLTVTLLQNQTSSRIEWVKISDSAKGLEWMALNYNHRYNAELGKRLPRTIDVYDIRDGIASKKSIVRFEYKDILSGKPTDSERP
jgi:hypothetical protein